MFSCSCASNTPTRGTVTFLALVPPRRQRCIQNDHMVRSPRIEATQICLQTNKSVCTPTPLRRHNTLVFAFLSQIELAHMKIMQVSSLSVFFCQPVVATLKPQAVCSATGSFLFWQFANCWKNNSEHACTINICIYICMYVYLWCYETVMPLNSFREQQAL